MTTDLKQYLPSEYDDIQEMNIIINTENQEFDGLYSIFNQAYANQFVLSADLKGIAYYEYVLKIGADPDNETLEFRRQRVLNRLNTRIPFTMPFLRTKLDKLFGVGAWGAWIIPATYQLFIEAPAKDEKVANELYITISKVKPCNMVFVNRSIVTAASEVPTVAAITQFGKVIMAEPYFETEKTAPDGSKYISGAYHIVHIIQTEPQEG